MNKFAYDLGYKLGLQKSAGPLSSLIRLMAAGGTPAATQAIRKYGLETIRRLRKMPKVLRAESKNILTAAPAKPTVFPQKKVRSLPGDLGKQIDQALVQKGR